jgi:hypothetical protein
MPPNQINIATGAIVVVTIAVAAAVAIYESPEVRQFAEDCRRKVAVALQSLSEEIHPNPESREPQQPRFNRPEDAHGFYQSSAEAGVVADEDSKRRQREELMYWNQVHLEKKEREEKKRREQEGEKNRSRGSSFDDFLHEDSNAEKGTYVYNSGANIHGNTEGLVQRTQGVRGLDRGAVYGNPFGDENHIEIEEQQAMDATLMCPEPSEMSDIYGAEDRPTRASTQTLAREEPQPLIDISEPFSPSPVVEQSEQAEEAWNESLYTSGVQAHPDAFASIHAWADNSQNAGFYSPLPVTPHGAMSEVSDLEHVSGDITPTDSTSLAGSGFDVGNASSADGEGRDFDELSEEGDGVHTPGSWSEVGSVVSEIDAHHHLQ